MNTKIIADLMRVRKDITYYSVWDAAGEYVRKFDNIELQKQRLLERVNIFSDQYREEKNHLRDLLLYMFECNDYNEYYDKLGDKILAPLVTVLNRSEGINTFDACFGCKHTEGSYNYFRIAMDVDESAFSKMIALGNMFTYRADPNQLNFIYEWKTRLISVPSSATSSYSFEINQAIAGNEEIDLGKYHQDLNDLVVRIIFADLMSGERDIHSS